MDLDFETIVISSETEKGQVLRYHNISFFQSSGVVTLCKVLTSKSITVFFAGCQGYKALPRPEV